MKIFGTLLRKVKLKWRAYKYPETMDCEQCAGMGTIEAPVPTSHCHECTGTGTITFRASLGKSSNHVHLHCGHCKGTGVHQ